MHPVKQRRMTDPERQPLASVDEVSEHLGLSAKTLLNWRYLGIGPRSFKVGGYVRYRWADIDEYVEANGRTTVPGRAK